MGTKDVLQSFSQMVDALRNQGEAVNRGDLSAGERMLNSQVVALNQIFGHLAQRAFANIGNHLGPAEVCLKLALKAQSQCRATLETLAAIKNPPVVFARQANINNGGQQQVNNGAAPVSLPTVTGAPKLAVKPPVLEAESLEDARGLVGSVRP